jgi:hypothetical protein
VLNETVPKHIERLRARIDRAAAWEGAPDAVREWGRAMQNVLFPILDRLNDAEMRASLAEARLEALRRQYGTPAAGAGSADCAHPDWCP